jgi:hypothetical protein
MKSVVRSPGRGSVTNSTILLSLPSSKVVINRAPSASGDVIGKEVSNAIATKKTMSALALLRRFLFPKREV